jgi:hypothetical protein
VSEFRDLTPLLEPKSRHLNTLTSILSPVSQFAFASKDLIQSFDINPFSVSNRAAKQATGNCDRS